ncbi:MAG: hypothetical protein KBB83_08005 [Alphaproteobacteria bacterium]|nr:hypothetical protein [Alphaproteobacteria bacterium]
MTGSLDSYFVSQKAVNRKDLPAIGMQISVYLKQTQQPETRTIIQDIRTFKLILKNNDHFMESANQANLQYLLYQLSSVIFQKHLELMAIEKLGNGYFVNLDDRLKDIDDKTLIENHVNDIESLYCFCEEKFFKPFMKTTDQPFYEAFRSLEGPQPYIVVTIDNQVRQDFIASRRKLARVFNAAGISAANRFITIHFDFFHENWLEDVITHKNTPVNKGKNKKNIAQYPEWLQPLEPAFEIVFVGANLSNEEKKKVIKDLDQLVTIRIQHLQGSIKELNHQLQQISNAVKNESGHTQKVKNQLEIAKQTIVSLEAALKNKTDEFKQLKTTHHELRGELDPMKALANNLQNELKKAKSCSQGLEKELGRAKKSEKKALKHNHALTQTNDHLTQALKAQEEITQAALAENKRLLEELQALKREKDEVKADLVSAGRIIQSLESRVAELFVPEQFDE